MDTTPEVTQEAAAPAIILVVEEVAREEEGRGPAFYIVGTVEVSDHYTAPMRAVEKIADHPGRYHAIRVDASGSSAYVVKLTTAYAD